MSANTASAIAAIAQMANSSIAAGFNDDLTSRYVPLPDRLTVRTRVFQGGERLPHRGEKNEHIHTAVAVALHRVEHRHRDRQREGMIQHDPEHGKAHQLGAIIAQDRISVFLRKRVFHDVQGPQKTDFTIIIYHERSTDVNAKQALKAAARNGNEHLSKNWLDRTRYADYKCYII